MKVSLKWLAEYVSLPAEDELSRKLTMAGLEVEAVESPAAALAGVVVAEVKEAARHPNADKLSVTKIDAGRSELLQVVCGAKNFKVGDKVPLATVGTKLPNGVEIKRAELRGVDSHGMLCSSKELGTSEEGAGLLILDPSAKVGTPIAQALGLDDTVFTLNVTPNRADALSHLGVAREVSTLTKASLREPSVKVPETSSPTSERVKVRIDAPDRCLRYAARVVEGVKIGPSPEWMQARLKACGIRAINNIVDVTNYVLLECGQPMHGFDLDQVAGGEIVVRLAKPGEKMTTLDGKERVLDPEDLLICDRDKPQVLAGVMGGATSEVSEKTRNVLLEAACFLPASVRRSSKRHQLHSESSHRFERGIDIERTPWALDRAAMLIAEIAGGTVRKGQVDVYPKPAPRRTVTLRYARVGALLGVEVAAAESKATLTALGFEVKDGANGTATVTVPSARVDVEREEDLIEEVARVRGYDSIPSKLPTGGIEPVPETVPDQVERRVRQTLAGLGFHEVINYSFVAPRELEVLGNPATVVLKNPLSLEQSVMRTTLAAGLLQNVSRNLRQQLASGRLYEIGRTYHADATPGDRSRPVTREPLRAAGVLWGRREARSWTAKDAAVDFFDAKGAVEELLRPLGVQPTYVAYDGMPYHPRAAAQVKLSSGELLGTLGELHPRVTKSLDLPAGVFLFELDLEPLSQRAVLTPQYESLPKFPSVLRDLAVVVPVIQANEEVRQVILEVGGDLVEDASVFDVYTGKPLPEGKKNLAYALRYRAADRTLTDIVVNGAHARIVEEVNARLGASLRGSKPE